MATSSIFADLSIKDKETAKAFVEALEASAKDRRPRSRKTKAVFLTDSKEIKKRFANFSPKKA